MGRKWGLGWLHHGGTASPPRGLQGALISSASLGSSKDPYASVQTGRFIFSRLAHRLQGTSICCANWIPGDVEAPGRCGHMEGR